MTKLDYSNGVQTRGGCAAEVFAEKDGRLWGRLNHKSAGWIAGRWDVTGSNYEGGIVGPDDLIPLPKIEKWYAVIDRDIAFVNLDLARDSVRIHDHILAFTFRDGVPDVSVAPEWVK